MSLTRLSHFLSHGFQIILLKFDDNLYLFHARYILVDIFTSTNDLQGTFR